MRRNLVKLAIVAALSHATLTAGNLRLCLEDRADLSVPARAELLQELIRLFPGIEWAGGPFCKGEADGIRVALLPDAPGRPADVLGAIAMQESGRLESPLLVFVQSVSRYSSPAGEGALGRALARVAGHEILHYLRQSPQHSSEGLLRERLSAHDLTRRGPTP